MIVQMFVRCICRRCTVQQYGVIWNLRRAATYSSRTYDTSSTATAEPASSAAAAGAESAPAPAAPAPWSSTSTNRHQPAPTSTSTNQHQQRCAIIHFGYIYRWYLCVTHTHKPRSTNTTSNNTTNNNNYSTSFNHGGTKHTQQASLLGF